MMYRFHDPNAYLHFVERIVNHEIIASQAAFMPHRSFGYPIEPEIIREMTGEIVARLYTKVFVERLPEKIVELTIETPATWFQHLKQSIAPKWFLDWYPIVMTKHTKIVDVSFKTIYPTYKAINGLPYQIIRELQPRIAVDGRRYEYSSYSTPRIF